MDGDDVGGFEAVDESLGVGSGGFDDADVFFDYDADVVVVGGWCAYGGEDGEVDSEWYVVVLAEASCATDPFSSFFGRASVVYGDDTEPTW